MKRICKVLLIIGAICTSLLAIGHIWCLFYLEAAFKLYGINEMMAAIAAKSAALPYLITVIIAGLFALCAIWGFSGAGVIRRRMPLLKLGIAVVGIVFLGRGVWGVTMLADHFSTLELTSTLVASVIGIFYLCGLFSVDKV